MIVSALCLGFLGLAVASSEVSAGPQTPPRYPEISLSTGFHLVVNLLDKSKDFHPPIQNNYVASIHVGAGLALVGCVPSIRSARIFYQNGTAEEHRYGKSTVITDSGTPPFPSGLRLVLDDKSETVSTARLDGGLGTPGIGISGSPEPYAFLYPETWVACNESIPYYHGTHFIIFKQVKTTVGKDGSAIRTIPAECAPVHLIPECTVLNSLPNGSYSSHEYAINGRCYKDAKSLEWSDPSH